MGLYLPQQPFQYLTRNGDVVDNICWNYYGFFSGSTEAVFRANRWVTKFPSVMPAGLLITLPVMEDSLVSSLQGINLWNYAPKASPSAAVPLTAAQQSQATQATLYAQALQAYQTQRDRYSDPTASGSDPSSGVSGATSGDSGGDTISTPTVPGTIVNWNGNTLAPPELTQADWAAVFYTDNAGNWNLGRINMANLNASVQSAVIAEGAASGSATAPPPGYTNQTTEMVVNTNGVPTLTTVTVLVANPS